MAIRLLTFLMISFTFSPMTQAAPLELGPNAIANEYIVLINPNKVRSSLDSNPAKRLLPDVAKFAKARASKHSAKVNRVYQNAVLGFSATMSLSQARLLAADADILLVEADQIITINATQTNATWGLDRIDQTDLPLDSSYTYNNTAANVNAYVIDTGIFFNHVDFGGRAVAGFDSIGDGRNGNDCNGHGTHVAGTVGSSIHGVAKEVRLYAVRVLNCTGAGTTSGVIAGVDWVAANHIKPAVANMSLGGGASTALDNAVRNAIARGVSFVVAAGNSNANACNGSPARVAEAITVGASAATDVRAGFSNFGTCLDIFAPGVNITSAWNSANNATNTISGTSMSSPYTAGVAALYLAANPSKTPAEVQAALKSNAASGKVSSAGTGSPNLLLQSLFAGTGARASIPLNNGETVSNIADTLNGDRLYTITVPNGASNLNISSSGGSGNADLYVRLGSAPQLNAFDCSSVGTANTESCLFATPTTGVYHILLHATADYSALNLNVNYTLAATNQTPVANFSAVITDLNVQFTDNSSDADGVISGWQWNFGDGASSTLQHPNYSYTTGGNYTASLTVTDDRGATNTSSTAIDVVAPQSSAPCTVCESYTGSLSSGQTLYQPNGSHYYSNSSGVHEGWLEGAAGTNFNLTLQRWNRRGWSTVASSAGTSSSERIRYNGNVGYYRWSLSSAAGSGEFNFWLTRP